MCNSFTKKLVAWNFFMSLKLLHVGSFVCCSKSCFLYLSVFPQNLHTPHKASWCINSACRNREDTALKPVTQQIWDRVEINYHIRLFTCHPAGPAAKTDLSSWHMLAHHLTNTVDLQHKYLDSSLFLGW